MLKFSTGRDNFREGLQSKEKDNGRGFMEYASSKKAPHPLPLGPGSGMILCPHFCLPNCEYSSFVISQPKPTLLPVFISEAAAAETTSGVRRDSRPAIFVNKLKVEASGLRVRVDKGGSTNLCLRVMRRDLLAKLVWDLGAGKMGLHI